MRRRLALGLLIAIALATSVIAARQPVRAQHGMVVAMESFATDVGILVLKKGGNAVDKAAGY